MEKNDLIKKYRKYPDLVTIPQFCEMLGGICPNSARKIIRGKYIKTFYIRCTYIIPKEAVIDYILSQHYKDFATKLKHHI